MAVATSVLDVERSALVSVPSGGTYGGRSVSRTIPEAVRHHETASFAQVPWHWTGEKGERVVVAVFGCQVVVRTRRRHGAVGISGTSRRKAEPARHEGGRSSVNGSKLALQKAVVTRPRSSIGLVRPYIDTEGIDAGTFCGLSATGSR